MKNRVRDRLRFLFLLAVKDRTGIIQYRNGKPPRNFHLDRGILQLVTGADDSRFFADILSRAGIVRPKRLARALRDQEAEGGFLVELVVEAGGVRREDLFEVLRAHAEHELAGLIDEPSGGLRFCPEEFDAAKFGEGSEEWLLGISFFDWVLEAARANGAVEVFDEVFPSPHDVPLRAEAGPTVESDPTSSGLLDLVDGARDLGEILDACGFERFDALAALLRLERSGAVRRRTPEELVEVARSFQREGRIDKCQKLFLQARASGCEDPSVSWEIARNFELTASVEDAIREYADYGRRAEEEGRLEDALRAIRHAIELAPEDLALRERLLRVLAAEGALEERAHEATALVPLQMKAGRYGRAADLILQLFGAGKGSRDLCGKLDECWSRQELPLREATLRAVEDLLRDGRKRDALLLLEHRREREPEDFEIRLRCAVLLAELGRGPEAVPILEGMMSELAAIPPEERGDGIDRARLALETLVRSGADGRMARRWLAAYHLRRDEHDRAVEHLMALAEIARRDGDDGLLCETLERVVELRPDDPLIRRTLGEAYLRDGRDRKGHEILRETADRAAAEGRTQEARGVLESIVERSPWATDAVRALLRLGPRAGEEAAEDRLRRRTGEVALALGRADEAREFLEPLLARRKQDPELGRLLLRAYAKLGARDEMLALLRALAGLACSSRNFGETERLCRIGLEIAPEDEELAALRDASQASARESANSGIGVSWAPSRPAADSRAPDPGELVDGESLLGPRKGAEQKPSISGIVERLRSLKSS